MSDVLPDGRVDHRGHPREAAWNGWNWACLECSTEDEEVIWTVPYDIAGRPIRADWRDLPPDQIRALCGMNDPTPTSRPDVESPSVERRES